MLTIEFERFLCPHVDSFAVSEHVCVGVDLPNNGPASQDFFLDSIDLLRNAKVDNLVELVGGAAFVLVEMIIRALPVLVSCVAVLSNEASAATPVKHFVRSSTAITVSVHVAIEQFLRRNADGLVPVAVHADAVFHS